MKTKYWKIDTCYLPAGRSVWWKTVTEGLKMLPETAGRGQHFQAQGHSFHYTDDLKPANNIPVNFFPAVNWLSRLQMGLFTHFLSFNGLARRLQTSCKKSWQRTSNSDTRQKKDVLKNRLFSNYFMLAVFISLIKFSKIDFAVWNFVRSLKFYYKNNLYPSLNAFKINWIGLFYFKLNSRKWENSLCVFQRNSPKYSNDQRGKFDWNYNAKLQTTKQTFTSSKHSDFLCHFKENRDKLVLTNRRWMCKRGQKIDDYR